MTPHPRLLWTAPGLVLVWAAARLAVGVGYLVTDFPGRRLAWGDLALYESWSSTIAATGSTPDAVTWMYPPLTAVLLGLVGLLPGPFGPVWVTGMLAVDLAVLVLLVGAVRRGCHPAGALTWAVLVPALGLLAWARLDLLPVAAAAGALLLAGTRPLLAGALAALGTATKAWPVVLGLLFLRERRWLVGAIGTGLAIAAAASLLLGGAWTFVLNLSGRGIQVESVLAVPWLLRQLLGGEIAGDFVNGTYEVIEPGAATLAAASPALVVLAVAAAWWLCRGCAPALRWYAIVCALLATSPLLSTQFVLWLIGAAAVAAALPGPDGALARRSLPVVGALTVLSHAGFPLQWAGIVGDGQLAAATLVLRNLLLLGLTVWLLRAAAARTTEERSTDPRLTPSAGPAPRRAAGPAGRRSRPRSRTDVPTAGLSDRGAPTALGPPAAS